MGCNCSQLDEYESSSSKPIYMSSQAMKNYNFNEVCVNMSCQQTYGTCSPRSPERRIETPRCRSMTNGIELTGESHKNEEVRRIFYLIIINIERGLSYTRRYLLNGVMKFFIPVEDKNKWVLNSRDILFTGKFDLKKFVLVKKIANGGFGDIYLLHLKECPQYYFALKKINHYADRDKEKNIQLITNEITTHSKLIHPFIISFIYNSEIPSIGEETVENTRNEINATYILMELGIGGNMLEYLKNNNPLNEDFIRFYTAEILIALNFIHEQGYVYKDLKTENILFGVDGHIRLCDFGLSTELFNNNYIYKPYGTKPYLSPEIIQKIACDGKSIDYWAFGCLLFELFTNIVPFVNESNGSNKENNNNNNSQKSEESQQQCQNQQQQQQQNSNNEEEQQQEQQLEEEVKENERKEKNLIIYKRIIDSKVDYPKSMLLHMNAKDLISKLLLKDYDKRLKTFEEIKSHSFFSSIDWDNIHKKTPPYIYLYIYCIRFVPILKCPGDSTYLDNLLSSNNQFSSFVWNNNN